MLQVVVNKTNIVQLPKKRTPLISVQSFLHQRCPIIGERTVLDKRSIIGDLIIKSSYL